jgi:hypothetical protein
MKTEHELTARNTERSALVEVETSELTAITGGTSPPANDIIAGFFKGGHLVVVNPPGLHGRGVE